MKIILLLTLLTSNILFGQSFVPNAPELNLKSYMLIEPNTNTVIGGFFLFMSLFYYSLIMRWNKRHIGLN